MSTPIAIAHDFTCPWCWVGMLQAKRLKDEFDVKLDWRGHVLWPEELSWPEPKAPEAVNPNRPPTPTRLEFILMLDDVPYPKVDKPKRMRIHAAVEAVEYFKDRHPSLTDSFVEAVYLAYWERGERIGDIDIVAKIASPLIGGTAELEAALADRRYKSKTVGFDADSYAAGVFNVPTFFIGSERYAEQPYQALAQAMRELDR